MHFPKPTLYLKQPHESSNEVSIFFPLFWIQIQGKGHKQQLSPNLHFHWVNLVVPTIFASLTKESEIVCMYVSYISIHQKRKKLAYLVYAPTKKALSKAAAVVI